MVMRSKLRVSLRDKRFEVKIKMDSLDSVVCICLVGVQI